MLPEEAVIIRLKYQSTCFKLLDRGEFRAAAYALLLRIHVITGWSIPEGELQDILIDQFEKKLLESYPLVNPDEVEYAFRNNTQVKDWGKAMNLSLIDEVMIPYLEKRKELSQVEEQKQPIMIEHKEDMSDKAMNDWAEDLKKGVKERKTTVEFMPLMVYEYLIKTGELNPTKHEKNEYLVKAVAYRHQCLVDEVQDISTAAAARPILAKFNEMKDSGVFDGEERERLIKLAKRMIMYDHFRNA